jgi:putative ABC transport system permease protein
MGVSLAEAQKSVNNFRFFLQPLKRIHLYSNTKFELEPNGDIKYVYVFSALAFFILLIACINFTNLSTARSAKRAREVGIRKVMGSDRKQLAAQFLAESVVFAYCAVILAFLAAWFLLPWFNQLSGKQLNFGFFARPLSIAAILLLGLVTGLVAGAYPALFLSSFNAIVVLKGKSSAANTNRSPLRSGLVIFQFAVSTGLIAATVIIYQQLHFMQDKKLGYNKEQVLYLQDTQLLGNGTLQNAFKQSLLKDSRVVNASIGTNLPSNPDMDGTQVYPKDKETNEGDAEIHANIFRVDYDYIPTLGIKMKAGRNFSIDFPTDSFGIVINEAAVRELGWSGTDPIGKIVVGSGQHDYKVIGVAEDFHYASVKQKIAPLMMRLGGSYRSGLIVKIKTTDVAGLLADIKKQWSVLSPGAPFAFYFLDSRFSNIYSSEKKTGQVFTVFSLLALAIACLGLFGLAIHITQQRAKEIGIRKVFGASVQQLLFLVSGDFLLLVFISFLISIPLTWWGMHQWLQDFAYRIDIGWQAFVFAAAAAIVLALVTVGFQAIKAAIANPVKSLRTE